jgi:hypothetical protein
MVLFRVLCIVINFIVMPGGLRLRAQGARKEKDKNE